MDVNAIVKHKATHIALASIASFAAGVGLGILVGRKSVKPDVERENDEASVNELQMSLFDILDEVDKQVANSVIEIVENEPKMNDIYDEPEELEMDEPDESEESPIRVIRWGESDWNYEEELAKRKPDEPYVIHQDEFINDEMEFHQETVTYYAGDDIMAGEDDTPIYNYHNLMGELKFGHGSTSKNIVYIRNEKIKMEWEVIKHDGLFMYEVLGHQMEADEEASLRHSVQKFRHE